MPDLKYRDIQNRIMTELIRDGRKKGDIIPAEMDYVKKFRVSRKTVRHAFAEMESDGLIRRIRGKGTVLRKNVSGSKKIYLIAPTIMSGIFISMVKGIEDALREHGNGYELIVKSNDRNSARLQEDIDAVIAEGVSAVLYVPIGVENNASARAADRAVFERLTEERVAMIVLDRRIDGIDTGYTFIASDNGFAGSAAAEHLLAGGYDEYVAVTAENWNNSAAKERIRGFTERILESGKPCRVITLAGHAALDSIVSVRHDDIPVLSYLARKRVGFFIIADMLAFLFFNAIKENGISLTVPERAGIITHDDLAYAQVLGLATMAPPLYEIGMHAGEMILRIVSGKEQTHDMMLRSQFIMRPSITVMEAL